MAGLSVSYCRRMLEESVELRKLIQERNQVFPASPKLQQVIDQMTQERLDRLGKIATREELQEYWTNLAYDTTEKIGDRLRASELLAKSQCMFSEKRIITGGDKAINVDHTVAKFELEDRILMIEGAAS